MTMQSKVIAGERVVYSPGAVMGFEFLEHAGPPKPKWTTPKDPGLERCDVRK